MYSEIHPLYNCEFQPTHTLCNHYHNRGTVHRPPSSFMPLCSQLLPPTLLPGGLIEVYKIGFPLLCQTQKSRAEAHALPPLPPLRAALLLAQPHPPCPVSVLFSPSFHPKSYPCHGPFYLEHSCLPSALSQLLLIFEISVQYHFLRETLPG